MTATTTIKIKDFLMIKVFAALLLFAAMAAPASVKAATVGLHLASKHDKPGFNDTNPGVYLRNRGGYTVGTVYNSVDRQAFYAGYTFSRNLGKTEVAVTVGGITGYSLPVTPMIVPSVAVSITENLRVRFNYLAKIHIDGANALHLAIERKF